MVRLGERCFTNLCYTLMLHIEDAVIYLKQCGVLAVLLIIVDLSPRAPL